MDLYYCPICCENFKKAQEKCPQCGSPWYGPAIYFGHGCIEGAFPFINGKINHKRVTLKLNDVLEVSDYEAVWSFIKKPLIRKNLAYNHQYLAILVNLYNEYDIKWTFERFLYKTIIITIASIIETAMADAMWGSMIYPRKRKKKNRNWRKINNDAQFADLISTAEHHKLFDYADFLSDIKDLKDIRRQIHLLTLRHKEYSIYTKEMVNKCLNLFVNFNMYFKQKEIAEEI